MTNRIDLSVHAPLPKPLCVYIEPTNVCNFSKQCYFCAQHRPAYKEEAGYHQMMPMEIAEKTVSDIAKMGGVKSIKLWFLGEPTLHPQIGEIVRLALTASTDVTLTTNGSKLDAEKIDAFIEHGLTRIRFSIYEETPAKKAYDIMMLALMLRLRRDAFGFEEPRIVVKWLSNNPEFGAKIRDEYEDIADEFLFEGLRNFSSAFVTIQETPLTQRRSGPQIACPLPFYQLVVKANGDVACCCAAWDQTLNIGNVMQESLLDIWRGEKMAAIQRAHLEGNRKQISTCSTCDTIYQHNDSVDGLTVEEWERKRKCHSFQ